MTSTSKLELRAVIKFCNELGHTPTQTHQLMAKTGMRCSKQLVFKWAKRFQEGRETVSDDSRTGRPTKRQRLIDDVKSVVNDDRRLTIREIAARSGATQAMVQRILHADLRMSKVSARWVPRLLSDHDKERRVTASRELLDRFKREGVDFLDRIITLDETWLHHFEPETKRQSSVWKTPGSPAPRKAKIISSMKKHMFIFVMDRKGMLLIHQVPDGQTVTAQYFSKVRLPVYL